MLAEFEQHLTESQLKLRLAKDNEGRSSKLLVDVKAGIDHLSDKLEKLKAVRWFVLARHAFTFFSPRCNSAQPPTCATS